MSQNKTVLLLENDALLRDLIKLGLGRLDCHVIEVTDVAEALKLAKTQKPAVMILDVLFSQLNSFDLLEILKAQSLLDSMKVVIISDLSFKELVRRALNDGVSDFIVKPFDIDDLVSRVQKLMVKTAI